MSEKGSLCSEYLKPAIFDHSLILINCLSEVKIGGRPFRFFNYLVDHPGFLSLVEHSWKESSRGSTMFSVWEILKLIKGRLKTLHHQEFKGIHDKINQARQQLEIV